MRKGGGRGRVEVQERLMECSGVVHVHVKMERRKVQRTGKVGDWVGSMAVKYGKFAQKSTTN